MGLIRNKYIIQFLVILVLLSFVSVYAAEYNFSGAKAPEKRPSFDDSFKKNAKAHMPPIKEIYKNKGPFKNADGGYACSTNSDCGTDIIGEPYCYNNNVYQQFKIYQCLNPATPLAICTHYTDTNMKQACLVNQTCNNGKCESFLCSKNSDCGQDGYIGAPFCKAEDVYQQYVTNECLNPNTANASCTKNTVDMLKTECASDEACNNGSCKKIACFKNSDCGVDIIGEPYCYNNNVYQQSKKFECLNSGTANAGCNSFSNTELIQTCKAEQVCDKGSCKSVTCFTDLECGINGFIGQPFCYSNNAIAKFFVKYICSNPGTINSACSVDKETKVIENCSLDKECVGSNCVLKKGCNYNNPTCDAGFKCINNECVTEAACYSNADCGIDKWAGDQFCLGNISYDYFIENICNNPGTKEASCSSYVSGKIVKECSANEICIVDSCYKPKCSVDADCGKYGTCVNGTCKANGCIFSEHCGAYQDCINNKCVLIEGYCYQDSDCKGNGEKCIDNMCKSIGCYSDSDCPADNYVGLAYCKEVDVQNVYQQYIDHKCLDAGEYGSACQGFFTEKKIKACALNEICYSENLKSECKVKSQVIGVKCFSMADCPHSWMGNYHCEGNKVYADLQYSFCYIAGTKNSFCGTPLIGNFKYADCSQYGQICSNGKCNNLTVINLKDTWLGGIVVVVNNIEYALKANKACTILMIDNKTYKLSDGQGLKLGKTTFVLDQAKCTLTQQQ